MSDDAEQTPEAGVQDPAPTTPPAPPALEGPWAKDIQSTFTDPEQQAAVDAFLRQTVQPHVTKLEQSRLPEEASQLWTDLNENPMQAYATLTQELFSEQPEYIEAIRNALEQADQGGQAPEETGTYDYQTPQQQLPPEVLEATQAYQEQKALEDYDAAHQAVASQYPDAHLDDDHFHSFVVAADGDFDQAALEWKQSGWPEFIASREQVTPAEVPDLPPTTIPEGGGHSEQPVQQNESLNDAIDGFFAEQREQAPPAVGSV